MKGFVVTTHQHTRLKVALTLVFIGSFCLGGLVFVTLAEPHSLAENLKHIAGSLIAAFVCYVGVVRAFHCA